MTINMIMFKNHFKMLRITLKNSNFMIFFEINDFDMRFSQRILYILNNSQMCKKQCGKLRRKSKSVGSFWGVPIFFVITSAHFERFFLQNLKLLLWAQQQSVSDRQTNTLPRGGGLTLRVCLMIWIHDRYIYNILSFLV